MQIRTSRSAEWEIRIVFEQVFNLLNFKFPLLFHGARIKNIDGIVEVSGMKLQPYEELKNE